MNRLRSEDDGDIIKDDNPSNFQLDLDGENLKKHWDIRFGKIHPESWHRPRIPDDQARDLIPLPFHFPVHGEAGYIPSGIKSWGENVFYWTGLSFIGGMGAGALSGVVKSYRQTRGLELPAKLKWNSMMNWAGRHGRLGSNGAAGVVVLVHGFAMLTEYLRNKTDPYNWIPAMSVCGAVAAARRYTFRGKVYDGGLVGLISGLIVGTFFGIFTAGTIQYFTEAPVLKELQSILGTNYFERQDVRYLRQLPSYQYDNGEIVEEELID